MKEEKLPKTLAEYVESLTRAMGNGKKIKLEVKGELEAHFEDALESCQSPDEKDTAAGRLLEEFGDVETIAKLIKRSKKRCRPLWKKALVRTGQGLVALVVLAVVYSVWFLMGDATVSVDYLARLNDISRPVIKSPDNAWTDYEKAIELYVEPDEDTSKIDCDANWSELTTDQRAGLLEWLDKNENAWQKYVEGSGKAYCFRSYTVEDAHHGTMIINLLFTHLKGLRDLSGMGVSMSRKYLEEGDIEKAMDTSLSVVRCGWHWDSRGTLIDQLVGMSIKRVGYSQVLAIIAEGDLTVDQMKELRGQLSQIGQGGYPHVDLESERLAFMDTVQHVFTEGGPGGGHLIPANYQELMGGSEVEIAYWGASIVHVSRNRTVALAKKMYDRMDDTVRMSPYLKQVKNTERSDDFLMSHNKYRYSLFWMMIPAVHRVSVIRFQGKAVSEAVDVIVALKLWEVEKGELPDSLAQLKSGGFLKELPDDPYSDGPLKYVKRDGDFVLYSVGEDFDDNGGKQHPDRPWGNHEHGGDRVFWPVDAEEMEIPEPESEADVY